jgi:hypothetical protein
MFHILVMYTDTCHMRPILTSLVLYTICIRDHIDYKLCHHFPPSHMLLLSNVFCMILH